MVVSLQVQEAATQLQASVFPEIDALVGANIQRVQQAFKNARIGPHHFAGSTGYGHGDLGRAAFDEVIFTDPGSLWLLGFLTRDVVEASSASHGLASCCL